MKIELTSEQLDQLKKDRYLDIDIGNGASLYFEFTSNDSFLYGEIYDPNPKIGTEKRKTYSFDVENLNKLKPIKPDGWYHDPLCPTCETYMIYKFECCPRCGQALDWRDRSD